MVAQYHEPTRRPTIPERQTFASVSTTDPQPHGRCIDYSSGVLELYRTLESEIVSKGVQAAPLPIGLGRYLAYFLA